MSKPLEKGKAVELRREGLSYREILGQVPVAKATLSLWLRTVGLSRPQKQRLTEKRLAAAQRGWEKLRRERLERAAQATGAGQAEASQWIARGDQLWLAGTVLYWAEGDKPKRWHGGTGVAFTNMDPRVILLMREWLLRCCSIASSDFCYALYIHDGADIESAAKFWTERLSVPREHMRIRLKKPNLSSRRKNTGESYHGTMKVEVRRSTLLNHRIAGWIHGIAEHCGVG